VKPPRFEYHDPPTRDQALGLLAEYGDEAKILAGGQSLMPILNFRLAHPGHLVDINRVADLDGVSDGSGSLRLGAMVRQRALERSDLVRERCPLIAQALPFVGHAQIRNRGTLGGSLAHADPAAELPAVMVALDAALTLQRRGGERVLAAEDFFVGQLATALEPDELLVRIDVPALSRPEHTGSSLQEVAIRRGDFALGGVATTLTLGADGQVTRARIVCFGVGERPVRQREAEQSLFGKLPSQAARAEAGQIVAERVEPWDDIHASAAYRKRLAGLLTERALAASLQEIA
jgi:aerobic carbon-monoxide dehydrogenase medium subunit